MSRRFTGAETRYRAIVAGVWLGAVALATILASATRSDGARVPTSSAFYLVFFTIPGVLLAVVMIRRRAMLLTVAVLAGAWSVFFSWRTMHSTRHVAGFGILVTPMVAFVIVAIGFVVDRILRRRR